MNITIQYILVTLILVAAVAWCVKRCMKRLLSKEKSCHCDSSCGDSSCAGCPLANNCNTNNKKTKQ